MGLSRVYWGEISHLQLEGPLSVASFFGFA